MPILYQIDTVRISKEKAYYENKQGFCPFEKM